MSRSVQPDRRGEYDHDGAKVRWHWTPGGYMGSTTYEVEGTFDQVTDAVERVKNQWWLAPGDCRLFCGQTPKAWIPRPPPPTPKEKA